MVESLTYAHPTLTEWLEYLDQQQLPVVETFTWQSIMLSINCQLPVSQQGCPGGMKHHLWGPSFSGLLCSSRCEQIRSQSRDKHLVNGPAHSLYLKESSERVILRKNLLRGLEIKASQLTHNRLFIDSEIRRSSESSWKNAFYGKK